MRKEAFHPSGGHDEDGTHTENDKSQIFNTAPTRQKLISHSLVTEVEIYPLDRGDIHHRQHPYQGCLVTIVLVFAQSSVE